MKDFNIALKHNDRIWVRVADGNGRELLRMGEVIAVVRIPAYAWGELHVAVRYLDDKGDGFECIPLTQVKGLCEGGADY